MTFLIHVKNNNNNNNNNNKTYIEKNASGPPGLNIIWEHAHRVVVLGPKPYTLGIHIFGFTGKTVH